ALFEVSTEKVDTEVPSAVSGVLRAILVPEGDTVSVGTPVAVITATADDPLDLDSVGAGGSGRALPAPDAPDPPDAPHRPERPARPTHTASASGTATPLSPVVRRLLAEHGLGPDDVAGSGRDGRITRADVLAVAAQRSGDGSTVRRFDASTRFARSPGSEDRSPGGGDASTRFARSPAREERSPGGGDASTRFARSPGS